MAKNHDRPAMVHNNLLTSCISFMLAFGRNTVSDNPRKFLKHTLQNIHRGIWLNHHTAEKIKNVAADPDTVVDWHLVKQLVDTDGRMRSGFSSYRQASLRTYLVKLLTGTLPTMDILNRKWLMYEDDTCPRCELTRETNCHVWKCSKAEDSVDLIISNFLDQHALEHNITPDVRLAITALPTHRLVEAIKQSSPIWEKDSAMLQTSTLDEETRKNTALLEVHTSKMQRLITKLISLGRDMVWKPRCEALIRYQKILGIFKRNKHPDRSAFRHTATTAIADTILETPSGPQVRINPSSINKNFDPFRYSCGLHFLLHSPGKSCNQAGLITNRAKF